MISKTKTKIRKLLSYFKKHRKVILITTSSVAFLAITIPLFFWWLSVPKAPRLQKANNDYLYSAQNNIYTAFLGSKENNTPIIQYKVKGANVTFTPASGKQKLDEPIKEGKELTFKNVYNNIDYKYQTIAKGIKEEIIINQPTIIQQFPFYLDFEGAEPKYFTENLAGGVFYDEDGNYIFHFEKPYAVDANGERTDSVQLVLKRDIKTKKYVAIVGIDPSWSQAKERVYPIYIDPTVVHDETSEFATGQFNRVTDTGSGSSPNLETYYQELPADEHTVGLWHLDESVDNGCSGGEDACDSSGYGNHGTATGTTITTTDQRVGAAARSFNGTSDLVTVSHASSLNLPTAWTVSSWIKLDTTPSGYPSIVTDLYPGSESKVQFSMGFNNSTRALRVGFYSGSWYTAVTTELIPLNEWTHVTGVYDGASGTIQAYINGVLKKTTYGVPSSIGNVTSEKRIGRRWDSPEYIDGVIDEVRISNIARTPEEIKLAAQRRPYSIYTSDSIDLGSIVETLDSLAWTEVGVTTGDGETVYSSTNLFAQWNFNETSGTTANNDAEGTSCGGTPSDCDGTLTNFDSTASQDADPDSSWTATYKRWGAGGLLFDNTDSYVAIGDVDAVDSLTAFTACAWVSHRTAIDDDHIIGKYDNADLDGFLFLRDDVGQTSARTDIYKVFVGDSSDADWVEIEGDTNTALPGTWNFVCTTFQTDTANGLHLYVNGVEDPYSPVDTTGVTAIDSASGNLVIGRYDPTTANYFSGAMDAVQLYGRVLSSSEILSLYNAGQAEFQTRTSSDGSSWEAWKPTTNETQILAIDSDATNWSWDSTATNMPKSKADESTIKMEGSGSMKVESGIPQADGNTRILYHMDETNGDNAGDDLFDSSGNSLNGEFNGTNLPTAVVDGISEKAREFNGSDDYITISDTTDPTAYTISMWVKPTDTTSTNLWVRTDSSGPTVAFSHQIRITSGSVFQHYWYDTSGKSVTGTTPVVANKWYHVAITAANSGFGRLYVNGKEEGTAVAVTTLWTGGDRWYMGSNSGGSMGYYSGAIDEIKYSTTQRSAAEIFEEYRMGSNHNLTRTISSTDLSSKGKLPYYIAADKPGTYLETVVGETTHSNNQPDANTSALLHLEEKAGSGAYLLDSSGNGYHGTPTNTIHSQGKIGKGRYFDGSGDYISLGNSLSPTTNFSVSAWVNPSSIVNDMQVVSKGYDGSNTQWEMKVTTVGGNVSFRMWNGSSHGVQSNNTLPTNVWTHLTGTYDGTTWRIYWNGILDNYAADTGPPSTTRNLYIGAVDSNGTPAGFWNGQIDEVEISSSVRSASEIRELYETGNRTHPVTIDFAASLDSGNLITSTSDTSFTIDATLYGLSSMGSKLFEGDKIIVKENVDGTEYIAQGDVTAVTTSTGAVTVDAWDTGSTAPSGGYTVNATVFKWQREYWDISKPIDGQVDAITKIALNITNGDEGRTIWLDDIESASDYLTDETGSTITSTAERYFQYRTLFSSTDTAVTPSLTDVTLTYTENVAPGTPTLSASYLHDKLKTSDTTPEIRFSATDTDSDDLSYKVEWDTDSSFPSASSAVSDTNPGFSNITTPADTDPFNSGDTISYTFQTPLSNGTTYYYRVSAKDPGGTNTYGSVSSVKSLTIDTALGDIDAWFETDEDQFTTDTLTGNAQVNASGYIEVTATTGTATSTAITAADIDSGQSAWGQLLFTDDETYGDIKYKIYYDVAGTPTIVPDVDLPGNSTGFDTSGVDLTGLSTSTYTILYAYAELTYSGGSPQLQDWTITMNTKPNAPTLDAPTGGTLVSTTPTMTLTATDPDTDNIQYKIKVCENSGMTTNCQTYDQSQSQTGWSGQDGDGGTTYTSGTQGTYVVQSALSAGQVYYWEGYALDPAGTNTFGTSPSAENFQTNAVPSAPTSLLAEGEAQPLFVTDTTPEFSAICNDDDVGQILNKYRIQVDDDSDFSSAVWDSGAAGTSMTNCTAGDRSSDISFGGTPLALDATSYYWRIKFWDAFDVEGVWSSSALFRMSEGSPTQCYIQESVDDSSLTLYWADNTSYETQFRIERNVNAAGFTFLVNEAADATSHEDTDITAGNTYQYRVRAENGGNSSWCTTETLDISAGTFQFQGLEIQGLDLE